MGIFQRVKIYAFLTFFNLIAMGFQHNLAFASPHLNLVMSVDWEGEDLNDQNLNAMNSFREQFPQIKLIHFLNAAYYTKPDSIENKVTQKISSVLRPGDELGLHIHAWKSLFEASGVKFKTYPTYWGSPLAHCEYDCGHEVPLTVYSTNELRKVIRKSQDVLSAHGFGKAKSFRAGGWLASPSVMEALAAEGIEMDSSSVPPVHLQEELRSMSLFRWVQELWSQIKSTSQPFRVQTQKGSLWEVPDNGALADYMNGREMFEVYKQNLKLAQDQNLDVYIQIGFHQETAQVYLPRVVDALRRIFADAKQNSVSIDLAPLPLANHLHTN